MTSEQRRSIGTKVARRGPYNRLASAIVRPSSFIGKELTEVRRQPRLLLTLVLGPFLILFPTAHSSPPPSSTATPSPNHSSSIA
jgi:hypothetical protein